MKTITLLVFFFVGLSSAFSQLINPFVDCGLTYGYDAAGNRITRLIVNCGSNKTDESENASSFQTENPETDTLVSEIEVSVYPNPNSGKFTVDFTQQLDYVQIVVVNNNGQVMLNQKTAGKQIPIDISVFAAGVYYVKLYTTKKEFAKVVVKK